MYFNWRLWRFTEGFRARIAVAVLIGLLGALIGIIRLALLGWLLAAVFNNQPINDLLLTVLIFIGTILLRGIIEHWRTMIAHETAALIQRNLRQRIYEKVVELGPAHFGQHRTGDAIVSLVDSVEQLETYFGQYLPQLFIAFFTPVLITGFTFYLDEYVAVVMLFSALFTLIAPMAFHNWDKKNSLARSKAYKLFAADFLDSLQGLSTLKSFGQSKTRLKLLGKRAHQLFQSTMWVLATNAAARGITDAGIAIGAAIALGVGAWRVSTGEANLQILLIVLMMGTEVFRPLRDLRALLHNGMIGQSAAFAIFNILDAQPIVKDINPTGFSRLPATLSFGNVSFSYPGSKTLIHNKINFQVEAGERIGIVGKSGSGKSTILKLLLRFYKPNSGVIKLGGNDITKLDFDQVRRQMAVVSQDTYLFHGSILENIGFGSTDPNKEDIRQAAIAANIDEFINSLPHGYNTIVGERGIRLSGGQRQRIAIARAILRDAPILILDEALSSVDAENEWVIQEALDRLMKGRTSLVIAHRLSSVIQCDRILVIKDGQIANSGSHKKLSEHSQLYQELMSEQIHGRLKTGQKNYLPQTLLKSRTQIIQDPPLISNPIEIQDDDLSKAENLSWWQVFKILLEKVKPWNKKLLLTLFLGVSRVIAFIGVGVAGALAVIAVKLNDPYLPYLYWLAVLAPIAGIFHWLESWIAHDMAFRMLTEMRIE
ncbi:MAG: putative multidrug export ATP-binding/permease protein, partial [Alphaproteobacteria bacterium MarineAlpha3_Bin5]